MNAGCSDNRWTASLYTWPPGCSPLVLPPSQQMGSAWVLLSLVGGIYTGKGVFQRNPQPNWASKIYGHNDFLYFLTVAQFVPCGRMQMEEYGVLIYRSHSRRLHQSVCCPITLVPSLAAVHRPSPTWLSLLELIVRRIKFSWFIMV